MAPLILDEEEAVDEDEDHGDNDHQHNHQAAVQVLQSTQRAPHLRKYIGDQDYFGCQMVRWNYNFVKVLKITKSSGLSTICLN